MSEFVFFGLSLLQTIYMAKSVHTALQFAYIFCFGFGFAGIFSLKDGAVGIGLILLVVCVICFGGSVFVNNFTSNLEDQRPYITSPAYSFNTSEVTPIMSLGDDASYSMQGMGHFILGTGSTVVNGKTTEYYTYYKKLGNHEYVWGKIEKEGIILKEDANKSDARIEFIYQHDIAFKKTYTDNYISVGGGETITNILKYIHIPEGSVVKDYTMKP